MINVRMSMSSIREMFKGVHHAATGRLPTAEELDRMVGHFQDCRRAERLSRLLGREEKSQLFDSSAASWEGSDEWDGQLHYDGEGNDENVKGLLEEA